MIFIFLFFGNIWTNWKRKNIIKKYFFSVFCVLLIILSLFLPVIYPGMQSKKNFYSRYSVFFFSFPFQNIEKIEKKERNDIDFNSFHSSKFFFFLLNQNIPIKHRANISNMSATTSAKNLKYQEDKEYKEGKKLFIANCNVCHINGKNLIIPEKNLKKETLEINGMNNVNAIVYQIINGKNGMPAFGGRLMESEIEKIAFYVLQQEN